MSRRSADSPVLLRPWVAVAGGAFAGVALATAIIVGWSFLGPAPGDVGRAPSRPDTLIDVFRLAPGDAFEMLLAPAGPDARGEPALSATLFPDEEPARELASVLVANTGERDGWDVDLAAPQLRARAADASWFALTEIDDEAAARLGTALALRFRGIGGAPASRRVAPGSLRRFLVALPPGRRFADISVVQWGERELRRVRLDLEGLHAFRERPSPPVAER